MLARVYLGRLLRIHLAGVHQDNLEGAGHVPHTCLYLLQGGEEKEQREATMYGVKIDTPTCCWVLGLQYTCEAKTRCGGFALLIQM